MVPVSHDFKDLYFDILPLLGYDSITYRKWGPQAKIWTWDTKITTVLCQLTAHNSVGTMPFPVIL